MTDRLVIQSQQDIELKRELDKVDWTIDYGSVRIQIRNGKVTTVAVERTIKCD